MPGWRTHARRRRERGDRQIPESNAGYDAAHGPARTLVKVGGEWVADAGGKMTLGELLRDLDRAYEALEGPVFEHDASYARRMLARLGERLRREGGISAASRPQAVVVDAGNPEMMAPWEGPSTFEGSYG